MLRTGSSKPLNFTYLNFSFTLSNDILQIAKLVLEDYFSSKDFLYAVDANAESANLQTYTPTTPVSHQLNSSSPFADSGIGLNILASSSSSSRVLNNNNSVEVDDDVFIVENSKFACFLFQNVKVERANGAENLLRNCTLNGINLYFLQTIF